MLCGGKWLKLRKTPRQKYFVCLHRTDLQLHARDRQPVQEAFLSVTRPTAAVWSSISLSCGHVGGAAGSFQYFWSTFFAVSGEMEQINLDHAWKLQNLAVSQNCVLQQENCGTSSGSCLVSENPNSGGGVCVCAGISAWYCQGVKEAFLL